MLGYTGITLASTDIFGCTQWHSEIFGHARECVDIRRYTQIYPGIVRDTTCTRTYSDIHRHAQIYSEMLWTRYGVLCTKADSTRRSSQAVPHPSTNRALCRLTSEVRRDPVHSTRYGRQRNRIQVKALAKYMDVGFDNDLHVLRYVQICSGWDMLCERCMAWSRMCSKQDETPYTEGRIV